MLQRRVADLETTVQRLELVVHSLEHIVEVLRRQAARPIVVAEPLEPVPPVAPHQPGPFILTPGWSQFGGVDYYLAGADHEVPTSIPRTLQQRRRNTHRAYVACLEELVASNDTAR